MVRPFPPISNLKAILFDVDGTLTESDALHYLAFRELLMKVWFRVPCQDKKFRVIPNFWLLSVGLKVAYRVLGCVTLYEIKD
jgi:phosphoglycolate phosphatase-like HAD superfamily hydrolase